MNTVNYHPDVYKKINNGNLKIIAHAESKYGWVIASDQNGTLWSISADGNSKGDSWFGDKRHLARLIDEGSFSNLNLITEDGLEFLSGLCSVIVTPENSKPFHITRFH
jgi:hypothetical protein